MEKTHDVITLDNGFRIVYVPFPGAESVALHLYGAAGVGYETPEEIGVAHFLEHLLFDGTEQYPTKKELTNLIYNRGGKLNGWTSHEWVDYWAVLLKEDLATGVEYLSQLFQHSLLREEDIAKEKTVIEQEYHRDDDSPSSHVWWQSYKSLFPNHRFATHILGEPEHIHTITRERVQAFMKRRYHAGSFVLGISGDLSPSHIKELGEAYFSTVPAPPAEYENQVDATISRGYAMQLTNRPQINQTRIKIDFPSVARTDKRYYAANLLETLLGDGFNSRLHQRIREEMGYVYDIQALSVHFATTGYFSITAGLEEKNLQNMLALTAEELKKMMTTHASSEELTHSIHRHVASTVFDFEKPGERSEYYAEAVLADKPTHLEKIERYKAVTVDELKSVAEDIFSTPPKVTILTPTYTEKDITNVWL